MQDSWPHDQVIAAYDALKDDPSRAVTVDQVRARLAVEHACALEKLASRVIQVAAIFSGDEERALFWYRHESLPPFGNKTAEQLVSDGRAEELLRYIASMETGASG